jgi:hypothetical protein
MANKKTLSDIEAGATETENGSRNWHEKLIQFINSQIIVTMKWRRGSE